MYLINIQDEPMNIHYGIPRLKEYRKKNGYTQAELAKKIGITRETVAKYETLKIDPKLITLMKICSLLDVSLNELYEIYKKPA